LSLGGDIRSGANRLLGLQLEDAQIEKLQRYVALLYKWNKVFSLTAIPESKAVSLHLLDSLSVLPYLNGSKLADVGTGPGLPGIPIAIVRPELSVTLIETSSKKTAFLTQAVVELGLNNVQVSTCRVEAYLPPEPFDIVISRAFSDLQTFARLAGHLCGYSGTLVAMKAEISAAEIGQLCGPFHIDKIVRLDAPDSSVKRCLIFLRHSSDHRPN
jgi:16S rRNA (guanine527-N7)-methyltransferase